MLRGSPRRCSLRTRIPLARSDAQSPETSSRSVKRRKFTDEKGLIDPQSRQAPDEPLPFPGDINSGILEVTVAFQRRQGVLLGEGIDTPGRAQGLDPGDQVRFTKGVSGNRIPGTAKDLVSERRTKSAGSRDPTRLSRGSATSIRPRPGRGFLRRFQPLFRTASRSCRGSSSPVGLFGLQMKVTAEGSPFLAGIPPAAACQKPGTPRRWVADSSPGLLQRLRPGQKPDKPRSSRFQPRSLRQASRRPRTVHPSQDNILVIRVTGKVPEGKVRGYDRRGRV